MGLIRPGESHSVMPLILKLLSSSRIVDGDESAILPSDEVREVACLFQRGRHGGDIGVFVVLLVPFLAVMDRTSVSAVVDAGESRSVRRR